jgi:hypothetical protein
MPIFRVEKYTPSPGGSGGNEKSQTNMVCGETMLALHPKKITVIFIKEGRVF